MSNETFYVRKVNIHETLEKGAPTMKNVHLRRNISPVTSTSHVNKN
jgi:hypothetical protein